MKIKIDDIVIAFDADKWMKAGDIEDNSVYFKKAKVI